jgi:hypothetical protein
MTLVFHLQTNSLHLSVVVLILWISGLLCGVVFLDS